MKPIPRELYPFDGNYLDLGDYRMHFLDEGSGPPVVCVHGNPTWSFYYRDLVLGLRDEHRVVVPDHVGCGLSDAPLDDAYDYTLARRIDDLEALVDHLDLGQVDLVVHDWGGAIGMGWAARHPDMVRRLVILNTAAFHLPAAKAMPWQLSLVRDTGLGALMVRGLNAFARGATHLACTRQPMPKPVRDAYCAPYDNWQRRIATLRFVQDIPLKPSDPAYATISRTQAALPQFADRPILICWGLKDFVFDHNFLTQWRTIYPDAEVHEYSDCGHYILEDAGDELVPLIQRFLAGTPMNGQGEAVPAAQ